MRLTMMAVAVIAMAGAAACTNLTAPNDRICATQARAYYDPATGISTSEVDHYRAAECPAVPIR